MSPNINRRTVLYSLGGAGAAVVAAAGAFKTSQEQAQQEDETIERRSAQRAFAFDDQDELRTTLQVQALDVELEPDRTCTTISGTVYNQSDGTTQSVSVALRTSDQHPRQYEWIEVGTIPPETEGEFDKCSTLDVSSADDLEAVVAHWLI